jgi:hypothetical protein
MKRIIYHNLMFVEDVTLAVSRSAIVKFGRLPRTHRHPKLLLVLDIAPDLRLFKPHRGNRIPVNELMIDTTGNPEPTSDKQAFLQVVNNY